MHMDIVYGYSKWVLYIETKIFGEIYDHSVV